MLSDLRYALRTLRKNPGFALVAILSLALGIGVNSTIFSFADAMVLRPLSVPHASQLIDVRSQLLGEGMQLINSTGVSYPDFEDLRRRSRSYQGLSAFRFTEFGFATEKGALAEAKFGALVSGDFFRVLEVEPQLGRGFRPDEDTVPGRDAVVVLSHDLWVDKFAAAPDVLGRTIFLSGIDFKIVGVAPESFTGPNFYVRTALYVPLAMGPRLLGDIAQKTLRQRDLRDLGVLGRLNPGVTLAQAAAETGVIAAQLAQAYPATNRTATMLADTDVSTRLKQNPINGILVGILLVLACLVLLIACANVANLMLSRARGRSREIAVRLAIGAGRSRLIRQLLTESLVVAVLGGALGLFLASSLIDRVGTNRIPGDVPVVIEAKIDPRVLLFTLLVSAASAILFGLVPAIQSSKTDLVETLKLGRAAGGKRRRLFGRNGLVIAQVAGSVVLLIIASQAYRGANFLLSGPPGYRTDHVLTASFDPTLVRYSPDQTRQFYKRLLDESRMLTGVKSAALSQGLPLLPWTYGRSRVAPEGFRLQPGTQALEVFSASVSDGYFATLNMPIVRGRALEPTDAASSPRVAVVNEQFARKYYPDRDAIGKRFQLGGNTGPMVEIVGVARQSVYLIPGEPATEFLYLPAAQQPIPAMTLLLHTTEDPGQLSAPLRQLLQRLDPAQPVVGMRTMQEVYDQRGKATVNLLTRAVSGMGLLGLALALVGLYGLMSYSVGLRQREIGIRMAVGANPRGVLHMVLRQGMILAGTGVIIGVILSLLAGHALTAGFGVPSFNVPLFALVVLALVGMATLGAYVPARRASMLDPNVVLRQE